MEIAGEFFERSSVYLPRLNLSDPELSIRMVTMVTMVTMEHGHVLPRGQFSITVETSVSRGCSPTINLSRKIS